jgi:transposase
LLIDNDGRHHNCQLMGTFLEQHGLTRIGYLPSNSPDLNPDENVFGLMKIFVQKRAPSTELELRQAVIDSWASITKQTLRNLFESMPTRLAGVIRKKGDRIGY